jgi:hypothetical protein
VQEVVRQLYWDVPELPVKTLEAAVGSPKRVRELAGPGPLLGDCSDCGVEVRATSRTQLADGTSTCKPCTRERQEAERARRQAAWARAGEPGPLDWQDELGWCEEPGWYDDDFDDEGPDPESDRPPPLRLLDDPRW